MSNDIFEPGSKLKAPMEKLAEFRHLPPNWDSYGAPMIERSAIDKAQRFVSVLVTCIGGNWTPVPCPDGGVQLEQHEDGFDIEITIRTAERRSGEP